MESQATRPFWNEISVAPYVGGKRRERLNVGRPILALFPRFWSLFDGLSTGRSRYPHILRLYPQVPASGALLRVPDMGLHACGSFQSVGGGDLVQPHLDLVQEAVQGGHLALKGGSQQA